MIDTVTFDATHTLFHSPRAGEIYGEVLSRHGVSVSAAEAQRLIRVVWQEMACLANPGQDRFAAHPEGARGFWQRFLERFAELLEAPAPSRFAAAELFHRFGSPDAWEVYPEVPGVLRDLAAQGFRLAVISNWDERLPGLLAGLGLATHFAVVVHSSAVGVEKPDGRIFAEVLRRLAAVPARTLHVGDSGLEDVEGAQAAGMAAVLLDRSSRLRRSPRLYSLTDLPGYLSVLGRP